MSLLERLAPRWYDRQTDQIIAARERRALADMRNELRVRWREACERPALQLSHALTTPSGFGPGRAPLISNIRIGDEYRPTTFVVQLRPGMLVEDLEDAGQELAAALFCHRLRFEPLDGPYIHVTLVQHDPHAAVVHTVDQQPGTLTLGPDEFGTPVRFEPARLPHVALQGTTGGGKSTALYWLLRQMVATPGIRIAGVDPSGLLFRPLPDNPWRVSGLHDLQGAVEVLGSLVDEMDARCAAMPWDDDKLPCGAGETHPWLFVVLEELPGLLTALDSREAKLGKLARSHISRLAAEGRKVGLRLVMIAQRFDANSTAGATVRNNAGLRLSFQVENRAAVEFLHEGCSPDVAADHTHAAPGVALVTSPGEAVRRVRFPVVTYRQWAQDARAYTGALVADQLHEPVAA